MEILQSNPQSSARIRDFAPKRGIVEKIDRYLRRSNTALAELANAVCPYRGTEYLNSRMKRFLDLGVAIPAAVVATPAVTLLGVAKRLEDGGSAFFVQERLGQHDRETIKLVKIRCMQPQSDAGARNLQIARGLEPSKDPRNTRLGAFMRKYQLEELPQVFQIIQGKLSVMGIRPNTQYGFDNLQNMWSENRYDRWLRAYHSGPMGVSGLNQVIGSELKEDEKRFHLDVFYAKNASFGLDLYLLWKTATKLIGVNS